MTHKLQIREVGEILKGNGEYVEIHDAYQRFCTPAGAGAKDVFYDKLEEEEIPVFKSGLRHYISRADCDMIAQLLTAKGSLVNKRVFLRRQMEKKLMDAVFSQSAGVAGDNAGKEMVNHPGHYNDYDVECIEMMRKIWGDEAVRNFCILNAFKYRMRAGHKDETEQDLRKERWYLEYANNLKEKKL